jgi:hypothetical protein
LRKFVRNNALLVVIKVLLAPESRMGSSSMCEEEEEVRVKNKQKGNGVGLF